jgi:hypothetical protein
MKDSVLHSFETEIPVQYTETSHAQFLYNHMKVWNIYFVAYVYKFNAILLQAMKSGVDAHMVGTFPKAAKYKPNNHILSNE